MRRVKCIKRADYEPSPAFCHGWMSELSFFFRCEFFAYDGWLFRSILQVSLAFGAFHICPFLSLLILCLWRIVSFISILQTILALTDIGCFFIQLLISCLRRIALQTILQKNSGAFDSSQMSPSTITYDLNVASMAENRVKCSRGDMSHCNIYVCIYIYMLFDSFIACHLHWRVHRW